MRPSDFGHNESCAEVVGVGAATLDDLWLVESFMPNEGVQKALETHRMGGGPVATALCVMSHFGHKVVLLDSCGDDVVGREILAGLSKAGVNTIAIHCEPNAVSARAVVMIRMQDGARQITYMPSSAAEPTLDERLMAMIRSARLLHLNGRHESTARACVDIAQKSDVLISYDGGAGRYRDSIRDLVEASHVRLLSREFAARYTEFSDIGAMMNSLVSGVAKVVVITDGINGSYVQCPGAQMHCQPAYPCSRTVDSTGCGDVFHGAFLHGYLSQWDVQDCADFASRLASKNAEGLGGRYALK